MLALWEPETGLRVTVGADGFVRQKRELCSRTPKQHTVSATVNGFATKGGRARTAWPCVSPLVFLCGVTYTIHPPPALVERMSRQAVFH